MPPSALRRRNFWQRPARLRVKSPSPSLRCRRPERPGSPKSRQALPLDDAEKKASSLVGDRCLRVDFLVNIHPLIHSPCLDEMISDFYAGHPLNKRVVVTANPGQMPRMQWLFISISRLQRRTRFFPRHFSMQSGRKLFVFT